MSKVLGKTLLLGYVMVSRKALRCVGSSKILKNGLPTCRKFHSHVNEGAPKAEKKLSLAQSIAFHGIPSDNILLITDHTHSILARHTRSIRC